MWQCKGCSVYVESRSKLLNHYKLRHPHFGRTTRFPCTYSKCPCTFKTWNALIVHQSRVHSTQYTQTQKELSVFSCHLCTCKNLASEREFFVHINTHLKRNENVSCMFVGCIFETSVYGTFKAHKSRKHTRHALTDFLPGIVRTSTLASPSLDDLCVVDQDEECVEEDVSDSSVGLNNQHTALPSVIEHQLAAALLKLEYLVHVPGTAIDEFLHELNYLINSASVPLSRGIVSNILQHYNLQIDNSVITEIAKAVCSSNPVSKAIEKGGLLSTSYQRRQYYKEKFGVVEPVTYILDHKKKHTFQYVPLLKSLQHILGNKEILDKIVQSHRGQQHIEPDPSYEFRSPEDGWHFRENGFLNADELRISLRLYVDDFETCNPLGTSRKKHQLCGVYWILSNLPPGSHSSLSYIYLAVLCKSRDVKSYGYDKVLEPLLQDLKTLEDQGVYVPSLDKSVKGTVLSVVADNLGAHGIAGFVESFSGDYFCRFCTGKSCDVRHHCVASGAFSLRTKEDHADHVKSACESNAHCFGVKRACVFTKSLSHFHVVSGFPPDIAHDIFEGIVPVELAHCLGLLISKRLFTLEDLNKAVLAFPYKWSDKTNKPHVVPQSFLVRKTIGGNAHENWSLLRLLPFVIGSLVPENEPAWLVLMDLKEIVELVVAPVHNDESISYLESKVIEHRQRYQELFPGVRLIPKHHFLEHYPQMLRCFGPLVTVWTMRFEAKHSFFKNIVKHTRCFKNVPLTLASKHQMMIAFHIHSPSYGKSTLDVSSVSAVPIDILKEEVAEAIRLKCPSTSVVHLAKNVSSAGIAYSNGMIVAHGSVGGMPEFAEIIQMCVMNETLFLIVKGMCGWYNEHYRAFELSRSLTREIKLVALNELADTYPLASYMVGSSCMVALKRHILIKD
ncbi:hypothetical protein SRHO_G00041580 [Serrasalmus rhombeus]